MYLHNCPCNIIGLVCMCFVRQLLVGHCLRYRLRQRLRQRHRVSNDNNNNNNNNSVRMRCRHSTTTVTIRTFTGMSAVQRGSLHGDDHSLMTLATTTTRNSTNRRATTARGNSVRGRPAAIRDSTRLNVNHPYRITTLALGLASKDQELTQRDTWSQLCSRRTEIT